MGIDERYLENIDEKTFGNNKKKHINDNHVSTIKTVFRSD